MTISINKADKLWERKAKDLIEEKVQLELTSSCRDSVALDTLNQKLNHHLSLFSHPQRRLLAQADIWREKFPTFWLELIQQQINGESNWTQLVYINSRLDNFPRNIRYRLHPHHQLIIKWHRQTFEQRQQWEYNAYGRWVICEGKPAWKPENLYRYVWEKTK